MGTGAVKRRKRDIHLHVMVTPEEMDTIRQRMAEAGVTNTGAFIRKMALNGYVLHVDLAPVRELVSLQRRCANNLNQVALHANTIGVYPEEIAALQPGLCRAVGTCFCGAGAACRGGEAITDAGSGFYCSPCFLLWGTSGQLSPKSRLH